MADAKDSKENTNVRTDRSTERTNDRSEDRIAPERDQTEYPKVGREAREELKEDDKLAAERRTKRKDTVTTGSGTFQADRVSDRLPTPMDVDGARSELDPRRGEELAREQLENRDDQGGTTRLVKENGVVSAVSDILDDDSDNGKVYKDARITPRDTNAPDAGLTPDGRRIAE